MKHVLIIPDGMGDRPLKKLKGKTPLEAARTPNMDFFASRGVVGLSQNIPAGYVPGTNIIQVEQRVSGRTVTSSYWSPWAWTAPAARASKVRRAAWASTLGRLKDECGMVQ